MSSQQRGQRKEPWRTNSERHYCAICNAWMASDRQSILLHENGKKHGENQEKVRQQKRQEKQKEEEQQKFLQKSLQQMEQAALQSHLQQDHLVASSVLEPIASNNSGIPPPIMVPSSTRQPPPPPPPPVASKKEMKQEKEQWKKRRKQRENDNENNTNQEETLPNKKKRRIDPEEGHYELNGEVFLEGLIFGELLEEDMPVQIWTGSPLASLQEKKLPERNMYWKNALIVAVGNEKAHVAYLASPNDIDETVEKNVPLDRIRIILGADESIPDTLEEARLMAMGGEEIQVASGEKSSNNTTEIDEATGLSTWSTVTIKRTTVRQEVKEERRRIREKRKQALAEQEAKEKEIAARKMEEAKAANADDSALGSIYFAELGREVQGYKGVDISDTGDDKLTIEDTAKSLAAGKVSVGFKKRVKKPMANRSQRTTSADDE